MIKVNLSLFISCLLCTNFAYSSTEVKPPVGPFISMLRATFDNYDVRPIDTIKGTLGSGSKEYNFEVPDLGRYSERKQDYIEPSFTESNESKANINFLPLLNNIEKPARVSTVMSNNAFDRLAIEQGNGANPISPFSSEYQLAPQFKTQQTAPTVSFDNLPVTQPQNEENAFYPPEWAQPNPLMPLNNQAQTNLNTHSFNPNSRMHQPFPAQMPQWKSGNQTNHGYR